LTDRQIANIQKVNPVTSACTTGNDVVNKSQPAAVAIIVKKQGNRMIYRYSKRGMKIIADFDLSALLVTRSEQGMSLLQPGKAPLHMPTQAQEVYDVTGAGDTVIGVLAATLAAGNTLEEACYFANAAAGVVVGKLGTSTVSPVELENAVRGRAETGFGVMTEDELKDAVAAARKRGEKVVIPGLQESLFGPGNHATLVTLFSMTAGSLIGLGMAIKMTHEKVHQPIQEARRLLDSIGWAFILPQILATLGLLFTAAGVGDGISWLTKTYLAVDSRFIAVAVYAIGMALLTMVMGNAFAAFPIVTAGIGIPILVLQHGGNPAVMAAIGMFSGYCGTLMTPMAANFNIVPAALLELPDKNAVIKAQVPTGVLLLIANVFLLYFLMFL
jgi:hypothetical protein